MSTGTVMALKFQTGSRNPSTGSERRKLDTLLAAANGMCLNPLKADDAVDAVDVCQY